MDNGRSIEWNKKDKMIALLLFAVLFLLQLIPILYLHTPNVVDEMGTIANAQFLVGNNWHDALASAGGYYYKYGQAVWWSLPALLFHDPVIFYRVCLSISSFLLSFSVIFCYKILRKHFLLAQTAGSAMLALFSCALPTVLFNALFARADSMLCLLPWMILYFLLENIYEQERRRRIRNSVLIALASVYMYMCHTRGLVGIIAVLLTLILVRGLAGRKLVHFPAYALATGIWLAADRLLTRWFKLSIWGTDAIKRNTAETFKVKQLAKMLRPKGIKVILKSAAGWVLAAFNGTWGLAAIVLIVFCVAIGVWIRKRDKKERDVTAVGVASVYSVLLFLGTMAMGLLYFFPVLYKTFAGKRVSRIDRMLYDRYMLGSFGLMAMVGLYVLFYGKDLLGRKGKTAAAAGYAVSFIAFYKYLRPFFNLHGATLKYIYSFTTFIRFSKGKSSAPAGTCGNEIFWGALLTFSFFILLLIVSEVKKGRQHNNAFLMIVLGGCFIFSTLLYCINTKRVRIDKDLRDTGLIEDVRDFLTENRSLSEKYHVICSMTDKVKLWQALLPSFDLVRSNYIDTDNETNYMALYSKIPKAGELPEGEWYTIDQLPEDTNANRDLVVKGDELCEELIDRGYTLTRIG